MAQGHAHINGVDREVAENKEIDFQQKNQEMSDYIQKESQELLNRILFDASNLMTNRFSMGD